MAFPTIPTVAAGRVLSVLATSPSGTHTSPDLASLTKAHGDVLIAIVITYDGNSTNAEFSAWGGGFTEFFDSASTTTMGIGCAYKVSNGTESGTFTVTSADTSTNDSAFFLLSIPGADHDTPPEAGSRANGTTAAADPGSFDPVVWDAEDTLWIAVAGSGEDGAAGSYTGIASAPANYTDYADSGISADVVGGVEGAVAFRQLNAASEDVGTFSVDVSNARNAAAVIAVRPLVPVTYIRRRDTTFPPGRLMPRQQVRAQDRGAVTTEFSQTLNAVVSTVASITKDVGKILAAAVTAVATLTANVVFGKTLNAAVAVIGTMTRDVGKILNAVVNVVGTMTREVGKILTVAVTIAASITKDVGKILNAVVTVVASLTAIKVFLVTLNAAVSVVASMTRSIGKILNATVSLAASIVKDVGKILNAVVAVVASMTAIRTILVTMSAAVAIAATMTRSVGKTLSAVVSIAASITKSIAKTLSAAVTAVATLTAQKIATVTLNAAVAVVGTMSRSIAKTLSAAVSIAASITKSVTKTLSTSVTAVASMIADPIIAGAVIVINRFRTSPRVQRFTNRPRGKSGSDPEE